ncbi:hypothetical protein ACWEF9_39145, partial [Streptomyces sp. NPDC004980]
MPYLERSGDVFVLYLGNEGETDNENRFSPGWIDAFHAALDEVEALAPDGRLRVSCGLAADCRG